MMNLSRIISTTMAALCIGVTAVVSDIQNAVAMGLAISLVFIWWGQELGSLTGNVFGLSYNAWCLGTSIWLVLAIGNGNSLDRWWPITIRLK